MHVCSAACELAARRLAAKLGTADAAMGRFAAAQATAPKTAAKEGPSKREQTAEVYAAGSEDNPIMLSQVKVASLQICQPEVSLCKPLLYRSLQESTHESLPSLAVWHLQGL